MPSCAGARSCGIPNRSYSKSSEASFMSCRATCQHPPPSLRPVTCMGCGVSDLHTFYTLKEKGLHLCPSCFACRISRGMAKEGEPQVDKEYGSKSLHL